MGVVKDWNLTPRPWYSRENGGFEGLHVRGEGLEVSRVKADGTPGHEDGELAAALKGVRQREEGEEDVLPDVEI